MTSHTVNRFIIILVIDANCFVAQRWKDVEVLELPQSQRVALRGTRPETVRNFAQYLLYSEECFRMLHTSLSHVLFQNPFQSHGMPISLP